jgi:O-succinylbenzoic acid--CoA ligase
MQVDPILSNPRANTATQRLRDYVFSEPKLQDHFLFRSSGSTGSPKWVALHRNALEASALAANKHLDVSSKDIFALALPIFHVGGYGVVERSRVSAAKLVEFKSKWNAHSFYPWLDETAASITSLVPAQIFDLVKLGRVAPTTLRAVVVGGGAIPEKLYLAARKLNWPLLPSYGLTECASQVATAELSTLEDKKFLETSPRGKLLPHIHAVQEAEEKVSVKSDALFSYYVVDSGTDFSLQARPGKFFLPDRVRLDADYVEICGRWEDEHKILGEWIRWDFLKKKFIDIAFSRGLFQKVELGLYPDERQGNKIALLCEDFDHFAKRLVDDFNEEVFPFERISHFFAGNLPRSELGKILALKINPLCLQEIEG